MIELVLTRLERLQRIVSKIQMESELCDGELNQLEKVLQTVSPVLVTFHNYFMELLTEQTIERYYETFPLLDERECLYQYLSKMICGVTVRRLNSFPIHFDS